jgi:hypothetical protein
VSLDSDLRESEVGGQCGKLGAGCNIVILLGEDADGAGGDFAVYYCLVLTDAKLLGWDNGFSELPIAGGNPTETY